MAAARCIAPRSCRRLPHACDDARITAQLLTDGISNRPTLPVVSREDPTKIVGMLDRRQILNLYERVSLLGGVSGPDAVNDLRQIEG